MLCWDLWFRVKRSILKLICCFFFSILFQAKVQNSICKRIVFHKRVEHMLRRFSVNKVVQQKTSKKLSQKFDDLLVSSLYAILQAAYASGFLSRSLFPCKQPNHRKCSQKASYGREFPKNAVFGRL